MNPLCTFVTDILWYPTIWCERILILWVPRYDYSNQESCCMMNLPHSPYCFNIVEKAFGDWMNSITPRHAVNQERIKFRVEECIDKLRAEYFSNQVPDILFSDEFLRWSYLCWATPLNALLFENVLKNDTVLQQFLGTLAQNRKEISVCCIGGGPGSEVLGLVQWTKLHQLDLAQLNVLVTDKFSEWQENWEAVQQHINTTIRKPSAAQFNGSHLKVRGRFAQVDVENLSEASRIQGSFDLYIVSYVISHIFSFSGLGQFIKFICQVVSQARPGSKFIFVDRASGYEKWKWPIRAVAQQSGLALSEFRPVPGVQEDTREDNSYMLDQGFRLPSVPLTRDAFWVVGTKV